MRVVDYDYQPGRPYGSCQRCGQTYRLDELKKEWTGLLVCSDDWDPLPDTMKAPVVYPEGLPYPDPAPDMPNVFISHNITPSEL